METKPSKNVSSSVETNSRKSRIVVILALAIVIAGVQAHAASLLNVDFGWGPIDGASAKEGAAVVGQSGDFWNLYSRGDLVWRTNGSLPNLRNVDLSPTSVGLTVLDGAGAWGNGSSDPMYHSYIYPLPNGIKPLTVTLTNLPVGRFDIYLYSHDGNFQLLSGGVDYGLKGTYDVSPGGTPAWQQGVQYALFQSVAVLNSAEPVTIVARPGVRDVAQIAGLQIVFVPEPGVGAMLISAFSLGIWRRRKKGELGDQ